MDSTKNTDEAADSANPPPPPVQAPGSGEPPKAADSDDPPPPPVEATDSGEPPKAADSDDPPPPPVQATDSGEPPKAVDSDDPPPPPVQATDSGEPPKAADSDDPPPPPPPVQAKPIDKASRDMLLNFPWSSLFAPYPYTEFKQSSSKSKWMRGLEVSSDSSDGDEASLAVIEWMQDPEYQGPLVETGPSSPVDSPPEWEEEKPLAPKLVEAPVHSHPRLLMPRKIAGFDERNYDDFDPYEDAEVYSNQYRDYDLTTYKTNDEYKTLCTDHYTDHSKTGAGLNNLGNTCFVNSVLQCMVHTVPLLESILSNTHSLGCSCPTSFCLPCCLRELFQAMTLGGKKFVAPRDLVKNLSYFAENFTCGQQDDAHEFLMKLWTKLEECHDGKTPHSDCLIRRVFGGQIVSKLTCCSCANVTLSREDIIELLLPVEKPDNLHMALKTYMEATVPEYRCGKCGKKEDAMQKMELDQFPPIVTYELKRFDSKSNKLTKHVQFPLVLDLLPFAATHDPDLKYDLYAVIVHYGERTTVGHYYSFIRLSPNEWFRFDDSVVSPVTVEEVHQQMAYVLFYAKQGTTWFSDAIRALRSSQGSTSLAASQPPVSAPEDNMQKPSRSKPAQADEISLIRGEEVDKTDEDAGSIAEKNADEDSEAKASKSLGDARKVDEADEHAGSIGEKKADEDSETRASKSLDDATKLGDAMSEIDKKHENEVEERAEEVKKTLSVKGLPNFGTTCYINSVLQCLRYTAPLYEGLSTHRCTFGENCIFGENCMLCSLFSLFTDVASGGDYEALIKICLSSRGTGDGGQGDAHDFLGLLLGRLEMYDEENLTRKVFGINLKHEFYCLMCRCCDLSQDVNNVLHLSVDIVESLEKGLEILMESKASGLCTNCMEHDVILQRTKLCNAAPVLTIVLKRAGPMGSKNSNYVSFGSVLDLGFSAKDNVPLEYELYAVIVHIGSQSRTGHYYSYVQVSPSCWMKFNDEEVTPSTEEEVLEQVAYVFFYKKKGSDIKAS